jgi:SAM-dependent methyltransferase
VTLPNEISAGELAAASEAVGERRGWDFSRVRATCDDVPWTYEDVVEEVRRRAERVLDIGTGGGEVLRRLLRRCDWEHVVAIDHSPVMAAVAVQNLGDSAEVLVGDASALPVASHGFELVLDRHASVDPAEIVRGLAPGGAFVTQQVGPRNMQSIFDAFEWGSNWDQFADDDLPPRTCAELADEFESLGCRVQRLEEYEVGYAIADIESLVFTLKAVPFPESFDPHRHVGPINQLLQHQASDRGVETTEHRELLVIHKS